MWHSFTQFVIRKPQWAFFLFFLFCTGTLGVALGFEYIGGYPPCAFCLYERYVYVAAAFFSIGAVAINKKIFYMWSAFAISFIFLVGIVINGYHIAVEKHLVPPPSFCQAAGLDETTVEGLSKALMNAAPSCDQVPLKILNFSLAEYNFLEFWLLALLMLVIGVLQRKHSQKYKE